MGKRIPHFRPVQHTSFESSAYKNDKSYVEIYNRMKNICLNVIKYTDMPDGVDVRYLEKMLFENGYCFFFPDEVLGRYLTLGGVFRAEYDVYGNWMNYTAVSFNGGYRRELNASNSVIIYNNYTRTNTQSQIELMAWRIWNILRTIDTNVSQQKSLKLLKTTEQGRLTNQNVLMKLEGNEIYALVNDGFNMEDVTIDFTVPYVSDKLANLLKYFWNDFLTYIGVVSHNSDKKERENAIEAMGSMGATEMERNSMLDARRSAIERVNKLFGLNIKVSYNSELADFFTNTRLDFDVLMEDDNGNIHNNNQGNSGEQ